MTKERSALSPPLPPLNALRAFEAAARHQSFVKAAEELHVTPAAVSHQVKLLEEVLEVVLFHRLPRGLVLSEAGKAMLPELGRGFAHVARAVAAAREGGLAGQLRVTVLPSFAQLWLLPRLGRFLAARPEIDVVLVGSHRVVDLVREGLDLGIRYGPGRWPGVEARHLFSEETFPVCAPALLDGPPPLRRPADLRQHRLLHDWDLPLGETWLGWPAWLARLGLPEAPAERGLQLPDSVMLTEAAVRGLGVAIGRTSLSGEHLAAGRLVRPFPVTMKADFAYYAVWPEGLAPSPRVRAFVEWLAEESRSTLG